MSGVTSFAHFVNKGPSAVFHSIFCFSHEKKNNIRNITTDAEHIFFGACAKYFIANDSNLIKKGKLVYKSYNINTKFCTKTQFFKDMTFI